MPDPSTLHDRTSSLSSQRVVLIDDDENVRRSTTMMLRARGIHVDVYNDGVELLANKSDHNAQCLLIDYKMPRLDGLRVMERLRASGDLTPGLMVTGYYSKTLEHRAIGAGYLALLEKPIMPGRLIEAISDATGAY